MKLRFLFTFVAGLILAAAHSATGEIFAIPWFTVGGGGGTSTGGNFAVTGTVGQCDAGRMSGGSFSLEGGFWAASPALLPGAPRLRVQATITNTVLIAWPASAVGFSLEHKSSLSDAAWAAVSNAPTLVGSEYQVLVAPAAGMGFYRLKYP